MRERLVVLDARIPEQRERWAQLWGRWPGREVWAHPAYSLLFASPGEQALCAALSQDDGGILFPMRLRPIAAEPWADPSDPRWDMTSPYGYGGAFAWGGGQGAAAAFWEWLDEWLAARRVIAWFCRVGLFPEQLLPLMPGLCFDRNNVVRSTREPPAAIWRDYAHKVRKNVNRARAAGLVCEADESGRELALFIDLYHRTLRRRDADPFYHFEREFFERLREGLAGQHAFFYVRRGRELLAAELVLVSADFVYSFLGGTDDVHFELRPNDLLKHSIIEWAHARGKRAFVLGGGAQPDDGIYRYKLSFAPRGRTPFFVSTRTLDEPSLQELLHRRTVAERSRGREWTPRHGFFPGYRG